MLHPLPIISPSEHQGQRSMLGLPKCSSVEAPCHYGWLPPESRTSSVKWVQQATADCAQSLEPAQQTGRGRGREAGEGGVATWPVRGLTRTLLGILTILQRSEPKKGLGEGGGVEE